MFPFEVCYHSIPNSSSDDDDVWFNDSVTITSIYSDKSSDLKFHGNAYWMKTIKYTGFDLNKSTT